MNNKLIMSLDELEQGKEYHLYGKGWNYNAGTEGLGVDWVPIVFKGTGRFMVTSGPMDSKGSAALFEVAIDGVYRDVWFPLESVVGKVEKESTEPRESGGPRESGYSTPKREAAWLEISKELT